MQNGAAMAFKVSDAYGTISWQRSWLLHLMCFILPGATLMYFLTGPYPWWIVPAAVAFIAVLVITDNNSPADRRQPLGEGPAWMFDLQCYALTAVQLACHVALGVMASKLSLDEPVTLVANFIAMLLLGGTTAGYTGIVLAHEWIHRRPRHQFFLGRLLLMFTWYEHFATEHIRGHHPGLGAHTDPATARFGETFKEFYNRTVPAQFKSAWHLEKKRIGEPEMSNFDPRMIRHRVLQGVVAQVGITIGYYVLWGPIAMVFFVMQSRTGFGLLEVVNYIEHWGITRADPRRVTPVDSWDTERWLTLHTLIGLSRHADHHAQASRSYQNLRHFDESPKMPRGYYGTILMAAMRNEQYQLEATAELKRLELGPFRPVTEALAAE